MVFSVMIMNRDGSGDTRCFGTNAGYRQFRIFVHRLREMRRRDIPAVVLQWRSGWRARLAQIAGTERTDHPIAAVAMEKAQRPRHNRIQSSEPLGSEALSR